MAAQSKSVFHLQSEKWELVAPKSGPATRTRYRRQSMNPGAPLPHPGVVVKRILPVFGYDEAPHGHAEVVFDNVHRPPTYCSATAAALRSRQAGSGRAASTIACG